MANDATKVSVGSPNVSGGVAIGPLTATLPTTAKTALHASLIKMGYVSDEGVEPTGDAPTIAEIFAWGGDLVASPQERKGTRKYRFTLIEVFNTDVNNFVFGVGNVTVTAAGGGNGTRIAVQDKADSPADSVVVFELAYKGKAIRLVAPNASVAILSETPFVDNDVQGYECEITCKPNSSGVYVYRYLENTDVLP